MTGGNGTLTAGGGCHHGDGFFDSSTFWNATLARSSGVFGAHRTRRFSPANRRVRSTSIRRPSMRSCHGASGHQSNVAIFNAATGKADRVGAKILADGKKVRVYKSSGEEIKA